MKNRFETPVLIVIKWDEKDILTSSVGEVFNDNFVSFNDLSIYY